MSPRALFALVAIACIARAAARPVRRTMNFNMFVLHPQQGSDRVLLSTDGVSRFGPILEYLVQRVQGMMSVKLPQEQPVDNIVAELPAVLKAGEIPDTSENEVDGVQAVQEKMPGVVVRPSPSKPGTFEVEINVVVDDGQPEDKHKN